MGLQRQGSSASTREEGLGDLGDPRHDLHT